jgi:nicotinamidase-related amidase
MKIRILVILMILCCLGCNKNNSKFTFNPDNNWTNSILLVIDMQKGLLDTNSSQHVEFAMIDKLISNVNENIIKAKLKGIPVVYIKNEWSNPLMNFMTKNVCKTGTEQVELDKRINVEGNLIFVKNVPNSFSNNLFCEYIANNKIGTIYIQGIMAQACVYATGKAGINNNLKIVMLEDAIGSTSSKTKENMIKKYSSNHMLIQKQL